MSLLIAIIPIALFSALAFWKPTAPLFMLVAGGSLIVGLTWYDAYTTNLGLAIGMVMIGYSLVCLGFAFSCILWTESED